MFDVSITESKSSLGHDIASHALEVLTKYYPGYRWYVRADGGVLDIKSAKIGRASMVRHLNSIQGDWTTFEQDIKRAAGEFLERASLRRGLATGERANRLDGGKAIRWQPPAL